MGGQDSNTATTERSRYNNEEPGTDNPSAWDPQVVLKYHNMQVSNWQPENLSNNQVMIFITKEVIGDKSFQHGTGFSTKKT